MKKIIFTIVFLLLSIHLLLIENYIASVLSLALFIRNFIEYLEQKF